LLCLKKGVQALGGTPPWQICAEHPKHKNMSKCGFEDVTAKPSKKIKTL